MRTAKTKGRPTYNLICQMQGEHGYRRADAREAFTAGLDGVIPNGWQFSNENAWLEVWLTIRGRTAVCGVRLSDRTMRHRTYKLDHVAASLRPTVAAAMVRLAGIGPGMTVLDPMCGIGTTLVEAIHQGRDAIGVELEPRWAAVATDNTVLAREQGASAQALCVEGDARRLGRGLLDELAGQVPLILTSPPYGPSLHGQVKAGHGRPVEKWDDRYSRNPGNLAHLPAQPGRSGRVRETVPAGMGVPLEASRAMRQ